MKLGEIKERKIKIAWCDCKHAYQDTTYGKNQRVFNKSYSDSTGKMWICTVCNRKWEV